MKTNTSAPSRVGPILKCLIAIFCLTAVPAATAAKPVGQVAVSFGGQVLENGKDIKVSSGSKRIEASELYSYEFVGRVRGQRGTPAAAFIRKGTSLSDFLESISPGSSKYLEGSFSNASGDLPVTVIDRRIKGKRKVKGFGKVKVSMKLLGSIDADGTCRLDITKVKFRSSRKKDLGAVQYMKGTKLVIAAAPVVTFLRKATTVSENGGNVSVSVRRTTNRRGSVSVDYTTVPDSADSSDFTPTSGTITFAEGETSQTITVPILDNAVDDGVRRFKIELSNPSDGAFLGSMVSTKIVILDDE